MEANKYGKYKCPCCGFYTKDEGRTNNFEICPVCYWEDDGIQFDDIDYEGGANEVSLRQARENFKKYGAKDSGYDDFVREPNKYEMPDLDCLPPPPPDAVLPSMGRDKTTKLRTPRQKSGLSFYLAGFNLHRLMIL